LSQGGPLYFVMAGLVLAMTSLRPAASCTAHRCIWSQIGTSIGPDPALTGCS
jgi:hypothetical protein